MVTFALRCAAHSFPIVILNTIAASHDDLQNQVEFRPVMVLLLDLDDGVATVTGTTGLQFAGSIALKTEMAGWGIWLPISVSTQFSEVKIRQSLTPPRNRHPPHPPLQLPLAPLPPMIRKGTPLALLPTD
ncbi:hypothetical protein B0H14DRAFT_2710031, partial [Mycena olivaceomarginata]